MVWCMRWGLAGAWRCWAEVKERARAFESDLDGGGRRSSIGEGGARMQREGCTREGICVYACMHVIFHVGVYVYMHACMHVLSACGESTADARHDMRHASI